MERQNGLFLRKPDAQGLFGVVGCPVAAHAHIACRILGENRVIQIRDCERTCLIKRRGVLPEIQKPRHSFVRNIGDNRLFREIQRIAVLPDRREGEPGEHQIRLGLCDRLGGWYGRFWLDRVCCDLLGCRGGCFCHDRIRRGLLLCAASADGQRQEQRGCRDDVSDGDLGVPPFVSGADRRMS